MNWNFKQAALLVCLVLAPASLIAQNVILEETVPDSSETRAMGHNRRHSLMGLIGAGSIFGETGQVPIRSGLSHYYQMGLVYKLKATGLLSFTLEATFRREAFLRGELEDISTPTDEVKTARYNLNLVQPALGIRFNFDPKRGNILGSFLEIGGGPSILLMSTYASRNRITRPDGQGGTYNQTLRSRYGPLRGFESMQWVAQARYGRGRFMLVAMYRLTPIVDADQLSTLELPAISAGLQIAL